MTRGRSAATHFVLVLSCGLLLAGCGDERTDDRLPQDVISETTTVPPSGEEVARDEARLKVYEWVSGRNTILGAPENYRDTSTIGFAGETEARSIIAEANKLRLDDRKRTGLAELTKDPEVTKIDLEPEAKDGVEVSPFVQLRACIDASDTHVVDAKGAKVKKSEGRGPHPVRFHVSNKQWPDRASWRVAWHEELKGPC